ncbi:metal-dependent transcriptional regulator [Candidatus Bathyarchaeota archaeon]|nr:metal-dependent transcriptional regulator [Candidatus Bathyarchaeota archaeon]
MSSGLSEREEDYIRAILEVIEEKGYARIRDIANKVEVRPPSAVGMMKKLDKKKLVVYEKYGGVVFTPEGREIAIAIRNRHDTFKRFLEIILVPEDIAIKDAHILEHQLDPKTIIQFTKFVEFITRAKERPRFVSRWMEMFKKFSEEEDKPT